MLILRFWHNQNVSNTRYYKNIVISINYIVKLEWQLDIFYKNLKSPC